MISRSVIVTLLAAACWARTAPTHPDNALPVEEARSTTDATSYLSDFRYMYKVYQECAAADLSPCLKLKLIGAIDRATRSISELPLTDGITFVRDQKAATLADSATTKSEAEIEASLPRALNDRDDALNNLIADKVTNFFDSHSLQIKLPTDLQRSFDGEEGRGKKKKMSGLFLIPLILGGTLIPLALGALALLAGKALIVSKLALVLAGIIGLKKLLSGGHGGGHESNHEVVVGGHSGSGWGRSYEKEQAQKLAYNAYVAQATR